VPRVLRLHRLGPVQRLRPELWRRFTITLRRTLARRAGLTGKALAAQARLSYAKVAEYQRRGVVHFHAIVRLDGPAGPTTVPPAWATLGLLTDAIGQAARAVQVRTPTAPRIPSQTFTWGGQLDIRPVTSAGELTDNTVAGYVAKYATKAAECTGTLDRRVTPADRLDELPVRDHARHHIAECLRLGRLPQFTDLRLAAWAHMLGFRGHFSTKSRAYSITLGSLRADRAAYQRERAVAAGLVPAADDTTLVLTDWHFVGRGDPPSLGGPARRCRRVRASFAAGRSAVPRLLLTVPEAAGALAISRSKLYELLASGDVASIRIDGSRRIPLNALEEYVSRLLAERTAA
jgi:excisionase family DNA binding protein